MTDHSPAFAPAAAPGDASGVVPDFLVIGEALIDIVQAHDAPELRRVGGSPANVAVGLARLGHPVRLATALGEDADAATIFEHLRGSGVVIEPGSHCLQHTATALARLDASGSAEYEFDIAWRFSAPDRAAISGHVHTGSIAAYLEPGGSAVARFAASLPESTTLSFDPNVRPDLPIPHAVVRERTEALVLAADVVKASDEDLAHLYPGVPVDRAVAAWAAGLDPRSGDRLLPLAASGRESTGPGGAHRLNPARPRLVIATRGSSGALVAAGGRVFEFPAPHVGVRDTVGAGDSFMAGLLSGLADAGALGAGPRDAQPRGSGLTDPAVVAPAIDRALTCSALTVQRVGADLPWRRDLAD